MRLEAREGALDARAMRFHWNSVLMLCAVAQMGKERSATPDDCSTISELQRTCGGKPARYDTPWWNSPAP